MLEFLVIFNQHAAVGDAEELVGLDSEFLENACLLALKDALSNGSEPGVIELDVSEADVHSTGFEVWLLVDGLEHEAVVVLILGLANQEVVQVVNLDLVVLGAEQVVVLSVQLKRLALPQLKVVAACVGLGCLKVPELPLVLVIVRTNVPQELHHPDIALKLFEIALLIVGHKKLLGQLLLALFVLNALLAALIELRPDAVLSIVKSSLQIAADSQLLPLFLKSQEFLVKGNWILLDLHRYYVSKLVLQCC